MEERGGREGRRDYREDVEDQGMSVLRRKKKDARDESRC